MGAGALVVALFAGRVARRVAEIRKEKHTHEEAAWEAEVWGETDAADNEIPAELPVEAPAEARA